MQKSLSRILQEIEQFVKFKSALEEKGFCIESVDDFGYILCPDKNQIGHRIDLLITGLIHGNEVIGIEIINRVLKGFLNGRDLTLNLGFLLCNLEAARAGERFIESDLNRGFCVDQIKTHEHQRALQISRVVDQADFILDLHQTIGPTLTPFFVIEHKHELIQIAHQLLPEFPIITFGEKGFSKSGKTMLEYASLQGAKALVIECGQQGFSAELAEKVEKACLDLIEILKYKVIKKAERIEVLELVSSITNVNGKTHLVPGLVSYTPIRAGQILAYNGETPVLAPFDGRVIFPSYGEKARTNHELCNLGKTIFIFSETHP